MKSNTAWNVKPLVVKIFLISLLLVIVCGAFVNVVQANIFLGKGGA